MKTSLLKAVIFRLSAVLISLLLCFLAAELIARLIEPKSIIHGRTGYLQHDVLGWLPPSGEAVIKDAEFTAVYKVNDMGMNDDPVRVASPKDGPSIMALGDSHTFALGVSQEEAWPNVLERMLFGENGKGEVYNLAVVGYSVGQYYLRMRELLPVLKPELILIGFSLATDLYDIIPPSRGGFIYGDKFGRIYFDLDREGNLVEKRELAGKILESGGKKESGISLRSQLSKFALYRRFKRSLIAYGLGLRLTPSGSSLLPGLDTALKIQLDEKDIFRWTLVEKLIERIAAEAEANNAEVILINIPYVPQVYDEVWKWSFGSKPEVYDRFIASRRLAELTSKYNVGFIDLTEKMIERTRQTGKRLHFRMDGHPNVEGQEFIAAITAAELKKRMKVESPAAEEHLLNSEEALKAPLASPA